MSTFHQGISPDWAGVLLRFPDGTFWAFQVSYPVTHIEVNRSFEKLYDHPRLVKLNPVGPPEVDIHLQGTAVDWDPDGHNGQRLWIDAGAIGAEAVPIVPKEPMACARRSSPPRGGC